MNDLINSQSTCCLEIVERTRGFMSFLGIDVSTTATKALLISANGEVLATAAAEYSFETPRPLWSEQHPDLWWNGT